MRFNAPRDSNEAALMNARKKEKKKLISKSQKPIHNSDWKELGEKWLTWIGQNPTSTNINDFANAFAYPPYKFKKDWAKESEIWKDYVQRAFYIYNSRRDEYMKSADKFYLQILKQLPQYDLDFADIEKEQADTTQNSKSHITVVYSDPKRTQAGDEWEKKGKE